MKDENTNSRQASVAAESPIPSAKSSMHANSLMSVNKTRHFDFVLFNVRNARQL